MSHDHPQDKHFPEKFLKKIILFFEVSQKESSIIKTILVCFV